MTVAPPDGAPFVEGQSIQLQWQFQQPNEQSYWIHIHSGGGLGDDSIFEYSPLNPSQTSYILDDAAPGEYDWDVSTETCAGTVHGGCLISSNKGTFNVFDAMDYSEAIDYLDKAIEEETAPAVTITRDSCNVVSDFDAQCKWAAFIGDVAYKGRARIYFSGTDIEDNLYYYHAEGRYKKIDEFCRYVLKKPKHKCVDRKRMS